MNYGMAVRTTFNRPELSSTVYHNVTEIHYNYPTAEKEPCIAFESDLHGTGITWKIADVKEFETRLEVSLSPNF